MKSHSFFHQLSVLLILAGSMFAAGCGSEDTSATMTAADLAGRIGNGTAPAIFDVRTPEEFADGHVPGAINLPHTEVAGRVGEFSVYQDREVVVYCGTGRRAAMAEDALRTAGFTNVRDLEGHMKQWQADGYPIDKSVGSTTGSVEVFEEDQ